MTTASGAGYGKMEIEKEGAGQGEVGGRGIPKSLRKSFQKDRVGVARMSREVKVD